MTTYDFSNKDVRTAPCACSLCNVTIVTGPGLSPYCDGCLGACNHLISAVNADNSPMEFDQWADVWNDAQSEMGAQFTESVGFNAQVSGDTADVEPDDDGDVTETDTGAAPTADDGETDQDGTPIDAAGSGDDDSGEQSDSEQSEQSDSEQTDQGDSEQDAEADSEQGETDQGEPDDSGDETETETETETEGEGEGEGEPENEPETDDSESEGDDETDETDDETETESESDDESESEPDAPVVYVVALIDPGFAILPRVFATRDRASAYAAEFVGAPVRAEVFELPVEIDGEQ